jgi:hypothetical protein
VARLFVCPPCSATRLRFSRPVGSTRQQAPLSVSAARHAVGV